MRDTFEQLLSRPMSPQVSCGNSDTDILLCMQRRARKRISKNETEHVFACNLENRATLLESHLPVRWKYGLVLGVKVSASSS